MVDVAHVGGRAGDEVVQLYVHDRGAFVSRPVLEPEGSARVTLAPGERRTVRFMPGPDAFRRFDIDMRDVVEPATVDIAVGAGSTTSRRIALEWG